MQANCPSPTDRRFRNPYLKVYETGISGGRGGAICLQITPPLAGTLLHTKELHRKDTVLLYFTVYSAAPQGCFRF